MIPKAECKDRTLYRIDSRNLRFGVYRAATGGFLGLRTKFDDTFVFEEYHWENESFATVQPEEELPEELPADIENTEGLGAYCSHCGKRCSYVAWPGGGEQEITMEDGHKMFVHGQWQHLEPTECLTVKAVNRSNSALFNWLVEMEKKY